MPTFVTSSYLHSLRLKKQRLELEIQNEASKARPKPLQSREDGRQIQILEQGYHLKISEVDSLPYSSQTAYLGPGSSAHLLECLLKKTIDWHSANMMPVSKRLLPDSSTQSVKAQQHNPVSSFVTTYDRRKVDLQSFVPPSTQRAIIEHYRKTVSPEYPILPHGVEMELLAHENPLRWSHSDKEGLAAFALSIIFAISSSLITRDLDPNLSSLQTRCVEEVHKISQGMVSVEGTMESLSRMATALCALALCELITPNTGQSWDLLGRAYSTLEDLREEHCLRRMVADDSFWRLESVLLTLEGYVSGASYSRQLTCP